MPLTPQEEAELQALDAREIEIVGASASGRKRPATMPTMQGAAASRGVPAETGEYLAGEQEDPVVRGASARVRLSQPGQSPTQQMFDRTIVWSRTPEAERQKFRQQYPQDAAIYDRDVEAVRQIMLEYSGKEGPSTSQIALEKAGPQLPAAGATVGSLAGPVGTVVGAAAGELARQQVVPVAPAAHPLEGPAGVISEAAIAGAGEVAAAGVGRALSKLGKSLEARRLTHITPGAEEAVATAKRIGTEVTPGQVSTRMVPQMMESVQESALVGGGKLKDIKRISQPMAINREFQALREQVLPTLKNLDSGERYKVLIDTLNHNIQADRAPLRKAYATVAEIAGDSIVRTYPVTQVAAKKSTDSLAIAGPQATGVQNLWNRLSNIPEKATYKQLQALRSGLIDEMRAAPEGLTTKNLAALREAEGMVDDLLDSMLQAKSPRAHTIWRDTNRAWRAQSEKYDREVISRLFKLADKDEGGTFLATILKEKNPEWLDITRKAIADDKVWQQVQGEAMDQLAREASSPITAAQQSEFAKRTGVGRLVDPAALVAQIDDLESNLPQLFDADTAMRMKKLRDFAEFVSRPNPGRIGGLVVPATQAGAALRGGQELLTAGPTGPTATLAALVLSVPGMLGRLYTRPATVERLIRGLQLSAKHPKAGEFLKQLPQALTKLAAIKTGEATLKEGKIITPAEPIAQPQGPTEQYMAEMSGQGSR